jgi:pilus assembly protein CpaE
MQVFVEVTVPLFTGIETLLVSQNDETFAPAAASGRNAVWPYALGCCQHSGARLTTSRLPGGGMQLLPYAADAYNVATAILIAPDPRTGRATYAEIAGSVAAQFGPAVDHYPSERELLEILATVKPDAIFLHCGNVDAAASCATVIERNAPAVLSIAVGFYDHPDTFVRLMRSGIREFLSFPTHSIRAQEAIENIQKRLNKAKADDSPSASLYCFLPAKPGVGASTIAVNTALAAAKTQRVLLCDLDVNVSMSTFLLNVDAEHSIRAAMDARDRLDHDLWNRIVGSRGELDVLGPGGVGGEDFDAVSLLEVIRFAGKIYDAIFIDCSGNFELFCGDLFHLATQVFLVCTTEIAALHLGRTKAQTLRTVNSGQRVSVLMNRATSGEALSIKEVEKLLEFRVRFSFNNDYRRVNEAALSHEAISARSELGKQFVQFSESLGIPGSRGGKPAPRRRFLEFFSVAPSSFSAPRAGER